MFKLTKKYYEKNLANVSTSNGKVVLIDDLTLELRANFQ